MALLSPPKSSVPRSERPRRSLISTLRLERLSGVYLWALFIAVFGLWVPQYFLTTSTLHAVAASQAIAVFVAIAVLLPLTAGLYDLSVGATTNLCAITVVVLQTQDHFSMVAAIVITIAVGALIGAVNGLFVVRLHVDSFITTLGMSVVLSAVQGIVSGESQPNPVNGNVWALITQRTVFGFQIVFFYALILAVIMWWLLDHTPAGRYLYAIGGNREAARLSGIAVGRWEWYSLILGGVTCALGGVFYGSLNGPSLTFGTGMLLPAFAAVFFGSTQFTPGRVNLWGTVLAVYVLATGVQGLQLVTGVEWLNDMFSGVAVLGAVSFAVWRQRSGRTRKLTSPATATAAAATTTEADVKADDPGG